MEEIKRISYIDFFKSIGIILMIMGHIGFGNTFDIYIHAFHMPMFFFISGYLYNNYNFKKFIKKKFKTLIVPYFKYALINLITCLFLIRNFPIGRFLEKILFFNNNGIPIAGALWFLTSLFFCLIIFYYLTNFINKKYRFLSIVGIVLSEYLLKLKLPYSIDSSIYMLPIMYIGFIFKNFELNITKNKCFLISILLFLCSFPLVIYNGYVNIRLNTYSNVLLFYLNAIIISYSIFLFAKSFEACKSQVLSFIGKNSLLFLCLNQIIIFVVKKYFNNNISILLLTLSILSIFSICINNLNLQNAQTVVAVKRKKEKE